LLGSLYVQSIKDNTNAEPTREKEAIIPAVIVVETVSPEQTSKLIYYQMMGEIFLVPVGADPKKYLNERQLITENT
jgi:hypothetical protein